LLFDKCIVDKLLPAVGTELVASSITSFPNNFFMSIVFPDPVGPKHKQGIVFVVVVVIIKQSQMWNYNVKPQLSAKTPPRHKITDTVGTIAKV